MKSKILSILQSADDYVSGESLSNQLGVSRTTIWKNINSLRADGYKIDSVQNKGYRVLYSPDFLDEDKIKDGLSVDFIGSQIKVMRTVDSTNEEVKRLSKSAENGLIIAADEQTSGKGRFGRIWKSEKTGGIYFTILIRPELPPSNISSITLAAGYAVCLAIREYTNLDAKIKWPNDIIIENRKLCGILTEMAAQSDRIDYVAIGIGINVNQSEFPEEIKNKASSIFLETGKEIDRNDFLRYVIKKLDMVLGTFLVSFSVEDFKGFKELCATLGRKVYVERNGEILTGTAEDITTYGELIIKTESGKTLTVNSGEVTVQGIY